MLVETFEMTEVDHEGTPECEAEALELIEKLGLDGQKELIADHGDGTVERSPYRKMTAREAWAYGVICPKKTEVKKYSDGPIPVRVLQVAAHAIDVFDEVHVWSATDADIKDPVLVGSKKKGPYSVEQFILARWGDELLPFSEVLSLAATRFRADYESKCNEMIEKATAALAVIRTASPQSLYGKSMVSAWLN